MRLTTVLLGSSLFLAGSCSSGGSGSGGSSPVGCPDDCLAGTWIVSAQVVQSSGTSCGATGLESIVIQLTKLPGDGQTPLYAATSDALVMPDPGFGALSTLAFAALQSPFHKVAPAGFYYLPGSDLTIGLATGGSPLETCTISSDAFETYTDFSTYPGYAIVQEPNGDGTFSWTIDPAAVELCSGHLHLSGTRIALQPPAAPREAAGPLPFSGGWSVGGSEPSPVDGLLDRESGELLLQFPAEASAAAALLPEGVRLSCERTNGSSSRFVGESGTTRVGAELVRGQDGLRGRLWLERGGEPRIFGGALRLQTSLR